MRISSLMLGAATLAAAFALTPATARAEDIMHIDTVSGWDIIIDKTVNLGCAMQAEFEGNALVRMGLNPADHNGYLLVLDPGWTDITKDKMYKISMDLDGNKWNADAKGVFMDNDPGIYIEFDHEDFFIDMMKKNVLKVVYHGNEATAISLRGTNNALQGVLACQKGVNKAR